VKHRPSLRAWRAWIDWLSILVSWLKECIIAISPTTTPACTAAFSLNNNKIQVFSENHTLNCSPLVKGCGEMGHINVSD